MKFSLSQPKKPRRRAARPNYASAVNGDEDEEEEEEGEGESKGCSYPPEFPVGKTVFLENDRRRAGWIPAVVCTGPSSNPQELLCYCQSLPLFKYSSISGMAKVHC